MYEHFLIALTMFIDSYTSLFFLCLSLSHSLSVYAALILLISVDMPFRKNKHIACEVLQKYTSEVPHRIHFNYG